VESTDRAGAQRTKMRYGLKQCFSQRLGTCLSFGRRQASAGEKDLGFVTHEDYNRLQDHCDNVGKLLNGLINSLKAKE